EVPVSLVVLARDTRQHAQLAARQQAVRDRNAQHRRMSLNVQPITKPQRTEVVFRQLSSKVTACLFAKLCDSLLDEPLIDLVVEIHAADSSPPRTKHEIAFGYEQIPEPVRAAGTPRGHKKAGMMKRARRPTVSGAPFHRLSFTHSRPSLRPARPPRGACA